MKTPTKEQAEKIIIEFPDQDDFVCRNVKYFISGGEPDDNSIELAAYWSKCKKLVSLKINPSTQQR